jgi:hypothetical protein
MSRQCQSHLQPHSGAGFQEVLANLGIQAQLSILQALKHAKCVGAFRASCTAARSITDGNITELVFTLRDPRLEGAAALTASSSSYDNMASSTARHVRAEKRALCIDRPWRRLLQRCSNVS